MPFSSVPSSAPQLAPPPPPQPPQQQQQPLQSVLAIGRQQGWGAAAASARGAAMPTGVPSCRMGTRSSVTLMCPEADGSEWPISAPQFSNGCFNKRCDGAVGESFAACAAMAVPKGASEMDHNSYDAMQQQQQRLLCGPKNESAPAGNADAAPAKHQRRVRGHRHGRTVRWCCGTQRIGACARRRHCTVHRHHCCLGKRHDESTWARQLVMSVRVLGL
ncbi:hypothetical_protein (plasmid) [Leishmania braziliensis MHOM/BR/75/M2904]|uniref:Hypothetical_protein n=1 Tax=Leishmania braziliensis MHOM/BR/75/M2904 TaxID=420245 RepID=A0A3P3YWS2_LEIBR|nr:hypothetical_protein [Leishmania braziliensis MHOM/BR/75/M2904]